MYFQTLQVQRSHDIEGNASCDLASRSNKIFLVNAFFFSRVRSGSVIECLTRDRRAAGSSLTGVTALWSLSKTHLS